MLTSMRIPILALVLFLVVNGVVAAVQPTLLIIRNETNRTIVVQEIVTQNGQIKRLRPVRLLPGESVKQLDSVPVARTFEVYDAQSPMMMLCVGKVALGDGQRTLVVTPAGRGFAMRELPAPVPISKK